MTRTWLHPLVHLGLVASLGAVEAQGAVRVVETDEVVLLENDQCAIEVDRSSGGIRALRPGPQSLSGPWFEVIEEDRGGLLPWETWERGAESVFAGGPAEVSASQEDGLARIVAVWHRRTGLEITGEIELAPGDAGPRVRLTVTNVTAETLVDTLRLPVLSGVELGDPEDDWFTWPHTLGARFRVKGFQPGEGLQHAYPDFMYMQWLDLFDEQQGVTIGCLDDYGYSKDLFIGRDDHGRSRMGIAFVGCWIAEAGDRWTTPWVQIATHEGDWRAGADLYRPFAEEAFGPLDPPERVRDMPTAQCWLAHHASDSDLGRLFEVQQQGPIHASYLMKSLNTSIPEGWDGFRGSALELEEAFSRIRELGGSPALFTFDRAPFMGRPNYAEHAGRWTLVRRDTSFAEGFRDMMPSPFDTDWVRARVGEARRWVQAFALGEIHFDTAATAGPSLAGPSYHPGLPQRPNEVPHYLKTLYRAIRDACREYNPEFILRAEHCADFFYPEFLTSTAHFFETGHLVAKHNPPHDAQLLPMLFRYTLPRHAALQMPSMSDSDFWTYGLGMGYGFHGGGPSWCFNPGVRDPESPPGELLHRYRFYDTEWRRYYDFRVGFSEAVIDGERSDARAEAEIDGRWQPCVFPGPLIVVTHSGGGREVSLGQWYHESHTQYFGERFVGDDRLEPRPVRLRLPTRLDHPRVRLLDERGETPVEAVVSDGVVEVTVPDPRCFALEVSEGPAVRITVPEPASPGEPATITIAIDPPLDEPGTLTVSTPPGWPEVPPVPVPALTTFATDIRVDVPAGVFGRNYPIKVVLEASGLRRTSATHLKVMEPLTVLYGFDVLSEGGTAGRHCVDPGEHARLTVTCVNNTPQPAEIEVRIEGPQVAGEHRAPVAGVSPADLGDTDSPLGQWAEGKGDIPPNAAVSTFDFECTGVPSGPTRISVSASGRILFEHEAWPRTRVMDLNGPWQTRLVPGSRAEVGGAELQDNLDVEATTPAVWDGDWQALETPIRLGEDERRDSSWAIFRRLVHVPAEWRGADVRLRLGYTGAPWGAGGTLNLIYVNGWPAGRLGSGGECSVSSFLVCGGWNLVAVASASPNSLVDPCLFVRDAPAPERIHPAPADDRPEGAFLLLGDRPTGQGLTLPFIAGVPMGDHRRTDIGAGGEHTFIYLAVADEFLREPEGEVEVLVEYLDRGTAPFGLAYDSTDASAPVNGAFKDAPLCRRTDSGEWRTQVFRLADARLSNRQHQGADFRLLAQDEDLHVRRVAVRRAE